MPEIIIIPIGFEPKPEPKEDYSREFGMACWCEDAEQCQNEEH